MTELKWLKANNESSMRNAKINLFKKDISNERIDPENDYDAGIKKGRYTVQYQLLFDLYIVEFMLNDNPK